MIHTPLEDNGAQFVDCTPIPAADAALPPNHEPVGLCVHVFDFACE
jgi:hypothetical protein